MTARALALVAVVLAGCLDQPARPPCVAAHPISEINSTSPDIVPFLSADRRDLLFTSDRDGYFTIYLAHRAAWNDMFSMPVQIVPPQSSGGDTFDALLSEDGNTLWYVHGDGNTGGDMYEAQRDSSPRGFSGDRVVFPELGKLLHPTLTADRLTIYYAVAQPQPVSGVTYHDIYTAHRASTADPFGEIHALPFDADDVDEYSPAVGADGSVLLYTTNAVAGLNGEHIVTATRAKSFMDGTLVDGLGQATDENDELGALHADGKTIVFSTSRDGMGDDIWIACE